MSAYPNFEARIRALERRQINTDARVEEVDKDAAMSVKQLAEAMEARFKQITDCLTKTVEADSIDIKRDTVDIKTTMATKADIADVKADITDIKGEVTNIRTEMSAMESRILEAFKQMLTTMMPQ